MSEYLVLKSLHVLSSTLLFGTGIGSAWYLFFASRSGEPRAVAVVLRWVVRADWCFTATTIVFQPLSGLLLAQRAQIPLDSPWLLASFWLYGVAVACWLPVVLLQIRMRRLAEAVVRTGSPLPPVYFRLLRVWVALGVPALVALLAVFWLMVARPMA
jgi:uncharacterized membrane protein